VVQRVRQRHYFARVITPATVAAAIGNIASTDVTVITYPDGYVDVEVNGTLDTTQRANLDTFMAKMGMTRQPGPRPLP